MSEEGAGKGIVTSEVIKPETAVSPLGNLSHYHRNSLFSDITIVGPDGRKIKCHQVVLAAGSKRLATVLEAGTLAGEELPVRGVDAEGLEAVIKYLYSGEAKVDYKTVIAVYDAAHRLNVPSLVQACEAFCPKALGTDTACTLLQTTIQYNMYSFSEQCIDMVRKHFQAVVSSDDFLSISFPTLQRIMSDAAISGETGQSVSARFGAAWRWCLSELAHLQHLPEVLQLVPGCANLTVEELAEIGKFAAPGADGTVPEGKDPKEQPSLAAQLHQMVMTQMLGGATLEAAVANVLSSSSALLNVPPAGKADGADGSAEAAAAAAGITGLDASMPAGAGDVSAPGSVDASLAAVQALANAGMPGAGGKSGAATPSGGLIPGLGNLLGNMQGSGNGGLSDASGFGGQLPLVGFPNLGMSNLFGLGGNGDGSNGLGGLDANALTAGLPPALANLLSQQHGNDALQQFALANALSGVGTPGSDLGLHSGGSGMGGGGGGRSSAYGNKGVCQVEGCGQDLSGLREYHMRYKICEYHLKIPQIMREGGPQRFCQQCGRFHNLDQFDGDKRSCRARLHKHNARRRKRAGEADWDSGEQALPNRSRPRLQGMDDPNLLAGANAALNSLNPLMAMALAASGLPGMPPMPNMANMPNLAQLPK